jgi:hypothetical protein
MDVGPLVIPHAQAAKLIQPAKRPLDYPPPPNVVSNVPAVMLLRTLVVNFPDPHAGWLTLALASTLVGNLTITGSIANIIIVERAAAEGVHVGFRRFRLTELDENRLSTE